MRSPQRSGSASSTPQPVAALTSSAHGSEPVSMVNMQAQAVHGLVRVGEVRLRPRPLPSVPFHLTFQSFFATAPGKGEAGAESLVPRRRAGGVPPEVGSAM
ncbi:MAG: hypothetical protein IPI49_25390 [Myxococcales bacterium]|nr:hypothetical protein [Myxococcales bacterium]